MEIVDIEKKTDKDYNNKKVLGGLLSKKVFSLCRTWVLMKWNEQAHTSLLLFVIEVAQMMLYSYRLVVVLDDEVSKVAKNETTYSFLHIFFKLICFYPFFDSLPSTMVLVCGYAICVVPVAALFLCTLRFFKYFKKSMWENVAFYLMDYQSHILFIPLFGGLMSLLQCSQESGSWVMNLDNSMTCFGAQHIALAIPALLAGIALVFLSTIYKIYVFDHRIHSHNPLARQSSKCSLAFHIARILLVILFAAIPVLDYLSSIYMIVLLLLVSLVFWLNFRYTTLYHFLGEVVARIMFSLNAWTAYCIIIPHWLGISNSYLTLGMLFTYPGLICILYYFTKMQNIKLNINNISVTKNANHCLKFCISLYRLALGCKRDDSEAKFLLQSYISYNGMHRAQDHSQAADQNRQFKEASNSVENNLKSMIIIINRYIRSMTSKFPDSVSLKIFFILFLINDTKNYSFAWALTDMTLRMECGTSEAFILYCIKKELKGKADTQNSQSKDEFNAIVVMRQANVEKKFRELLEQLIKLYSKFWSLLQDKYPAMEVFEELGFGILSAKRQLEKVWEMMRMGAKIPVHFLSIYAKFTEEVEIDIAKAKLIRESMQSNNISSQSDFLLYYAGNGASVVTVSALSQTHGYIKNYNGAFCRMSGYLREELINVPVENIMPSIYREIHSQLLYQCSIQVESGELFDAKEKIAFLTHKSQHIIPVVIKIVAIPNFLNGYVYIASITLYKEWNSYNQIHFLLDNANTIIGFSSNAQYYLGLETSILFDFEKITSILPAFLTFEEGMEITPVEIVPRSPELSLKISGEHSICEWKKLKYSKGVIIGKHVILKAVKEEIDIASIKCNVNIAEFEYSLSKNKFFINSGQNEGSQGSLQRLQSSRKSNSKAILSQLKKQETTIVPKEEKKVSIHGFYQTLIGKVEESMPKNCDLSFLHPYRDRPDYGEGVFTYRLEDNQYVPLEKKHQALAPRYEDSLMFVDELTGTRQQKRDFGNDKIIRSTIKSKSYLVNLLVNMPLPPSFNRLFFISFLSMTIGIAIGITEFIILNDLFENVYSELRLIFMQFDSIRCVAEVSTWNMQAVAINEGVMNLSGSYPIKSSMEEMGNWTVNRMNEITVEFNEGMIGRENIEQSQLLTEVYTYKTTYSYNETGTVAENVPFQMAYYLEMDTIYNLTGVNNFNKFVSTNPHVAALDHNFRNVLLPVADQILNIFVVTMNDLYNSQLFETRLIVYICVGAISLLVLLQIPFIISINQIIQKQAQMFLNMPNTECRQQQKTAEQFFDQFNQTEFCSSSLEGSSSEGSGVELGYSRYSEDRMNRIAQQSEFLEQRHFSQTILSRIDFVWRVILVLVVSVGYILSVYFVGESHFNQLIEIEEISNTTVRIDGDFVIAENIQRIYFWDKNSMVKNRGCLEVLLYYHDVMYTLTKEIYKYSENMLALFSTEERNNMENFLFSDMCVGDFAERCNKTGVSRSGFLASMIEFQSLQKQLFHKYRYLDDSRQYFLASDFIESVNILHQIIRPGFSYMYNKVISAVHEKNKDISDLIQPILVVFVMVNICFLLFLWMPYIQRKKTVMIKTRVLLSLIPIEVIINIKAFQNFFSGILFKHRK